jgi:hypothetical protein
MPFEPLQTDEKLETPVPRQKDMDAQLLMGCTGFVLASIGGYVLSIWPYFAISNVDKFQGLQTASLLSFVPATIYGALLTRKFGLPGACGFFAGALATAIFLILRMQQIFLAGEARPEFKPEYPPIITYLFPAAWLVWAAIVALLVMPKHELPGKDE